MSHAALLRHCVDVLNSYVPDSVAVEAHVNQFLKYQPGLGEDDQTFILEVFSECVRYSGVLNVVLTGFFNRVGQNILRSEGNVYVVIAYLALFRLDELGVAQFREFIKTQDVNKMYKFLHFLFDEKNLRTWMKDEWNKLYEYSFVQTTLLSPIIRWLPELHDILDLMKKKIANKVKPKKTTQAPTVLKPFNLTHPRPRSVPIPKPIPKLTRHRPVPITNTAEPVVQRIMDQLREENRRKAEERLMHASRIQFACANSEKSDKTKAKLDQIMAEQDALLDFNRRNAHPAPEFMLDNISVKLNTAAILREGRLYKQREEEQLKKLEKLESGAMDASGFLDWQSKMRKQDMQDELAEIERRRLEGKLSLEEAILARQELANEKRRKAEQMKAEAARLMQEYMVKRMEEEQENRKLVVEVLDTHENAKEAKRKMQLYKASIVQQVHEESKELMRQALEEAEKEMQERMELIRQIRAMEATPIIRQKLVDFTETAGHGLLSEMSIAELRERICLWNITEQEQEDIKRDEILATKQAKDQLLMETLETISKHRTEQCKAAALRLEERKKTHYIKPALNDPKLDELQRKLDEKRQARKQLQEQSRLAPNKKSAQRLKELNASKKLMEESRWQELEQRQQKTAKLSTDSYMTKPAGISTRAALVT